MKKYAFKGMTTVARLIAVGFLLRSLALSGQVGIGTLQPDTSSILELNSDHKGFLMPRLTSTQRDSIQNPSVGLQIFNLDDQCLDLFDGIHWIKNCGWKQTGVGDSIGTNVWIFKNSAGPVKRENAFSFSIGNIVYIGTGISGTTRYDDFWAYDTETETWAQKAALPGGVRNFAVGFSAGGKGYAGLGYDGTTDKLDFYEYDPGLNAWTQKANFGGAARRAAAGFVIDGKVYVGTGRNGSASFNDFWEFNPMTNGWVSRASLSGNVRSEAVGFAVDSFGYIGLGYNDPDYLYDMFKYNPVSNSWTAVTSYPGAGRRGAFSFVIGEQAYAGAGQSSANQYERDFWAYQTDTDEWIEKTIFGGEPRKGASATSVGNRGYALRGSLEGGDRADDLWQYKPTIEAPVYSFTAPEGGYSSLDDGKWVYNGSALYAPEAQNIGLGTSTPDTNAILDLTSTTKGFLLPRMTTSQRDLIQGPAIGMQIFNMDDHCLDLYDGSGWIKNCGWRQTGVGDSIGTNVWTLKSMSGPGVRENAICFSIGDKIYTGTGFAGTTYYDDFWEYSTTTGVWTQKAPFLGGVRNYAIGFSIGGKGYAGLGNSNASAHKLDLYEYDPVTNIWTQKSDFPGAARRAAAAFVVNGKAYVGTGFNGTTTFNDLWEYNPGTDSWTAKANLPGVSRSEAVGFAVDSFGYIGLGFNSPNYLDDLYRYNPSSNSWTAISDYPDGGRRGSFSFSIDHSAYVGAGWSANNTPTNKFWQYFPAADVWEEKPIFGGSPRKGAAATTSGGLGYVSRGFAANGQQEDLWGYRPGVEAPMYSFANPLGGFSALDDGKWVLDPNGMHAINARSVGIGTSTPDTNAILELKSTSKGLLIPRMNTAQRASIPTTKEGMLLYDTQLDQFFYYHSGRWITCLGNAVGIQATDNVIGIGIDVLTNNFPVNGHNNIGIGSSALKMNTTGYYNTAIGTESQMSNTSGKQNIGIGHRTLFSNTIGDNNTALGFKALVNNFGGYENTTIGSEAMQANTNGHANTGLGMRALYSNTTGDFNTGIGAFALINNVAGDANTAIGYASLNLIASGSNNTSVGNYAGNMNSSGSGNVFLGYQAGYNETSSNKLYIDNEAGLLADALIYGDFATGKLRVNNFLGVGKNATTNAVEVNGTASKSAAGEWLANSDSRLKKNIKPLDGTDALTKLLSLQGVTYEWDDHVTEYVRPEGIQYGFTAQNIQSVFPELVSTDADGFLQTAYGTYDPMMIEAIRTIDNKTKLLESKSVQIEELQTQLKTKEDAIAQILLELSSLKKDIAEMKVIMQEIH